MSTPIRLSTEWLGDVAIPRGTNGLLFETRNGTPYLHNNLEQRWLTPRLQAENLAKLTDEVELAIHTAYNKLERTQQMLEVSEEVVALRSESNRVLQQELLQGAALKSQAAMATAQEYDAKALLLQSQLDYSQAHDEFVHAMGRTPD